ncbi:MAG TPA: hypothetical protein VIN07_10660 [Flavipsychrobacter sp.]
MKVTGIVLIVVGILMLIFNTINFTTEEKVVDIGPLEINKEEEKTIGWPVYAGGIVLIAGIALVAVGAKKK